MAAAIQARRRRTQPASLATLDLLLHRAWRVARRAAAEARYSVVERAWSDLDRRA
jgi:hypothetical protein